MARYASTGCAAVGSGYTYRQLLLCCHVGIGVMILVVDENLSLPGSIVDTMALHLRIPIGFGAHKLEVH
jgi:hypothetical protein